MAFVSAGATALPVRLHGVTKRFGAAPVLSGIDLEIAPGAVQRVREAYLEEADD